MAEPEFDPNGGTFLASVGVAISCATQGATIRYTTDGSTPTSSHGTIYSNVFQLTTSATVKAIACESGMADSSVASVRFVVKSTMRVSVKSLTGAEADGDSHNPSISADGRFVAFESNAVNLLTGSVYVDNGVKDVFVHDRQTGGTTQVSLSSGYAQGNLASDNPSISSDGMCVALVSSATNLVEGDTNDKQDIFVRDHQANQTLRVSVKADTGAQANDHSYRPSISGDGRYVAFESQATNLLAGSQIIDTNGAIDIFVHDRQTGHTSRVSVSSSYAQADGDSSMPCISSDGRYVAFQSEATNLVEDDMNGVADVFVHDRQTNQTTRASVNSAEEEADSYSLSPALSADGRYVAFSSEATNLVGGDNNGERDIFVRDRQTGQTTRVNVRTITGEESNAFSSGPSISADGRHVAFTSNATNLVQSSDNNNLPDVFIHDRDTGETIQVSVSSAGIQGDGDSRSPAVSSDGRYVAFHSSSTNLVADDENGLPDVFVHDRGE